MFEAAQATYVHWLSSGITPDDLMPTRAADHVVPAGVARRYEHLLERSPKTIDRLAVVLVGAWAVAALLRLCWVYWVP